MRELWIEGDAQVGGLLVAKSYYFGGVQGDSEFWWMRIDSEGERTDITEPTMCDVTKPLPDPNSPAGDADVDPRVHRVTEADLGCCIKVVCRPRRADGETVRVSVRTCAVGRMGGCVFATRSLSYSMQGYPTTSRPTRAVKPAPEGSTPAPAAAPAAAAPAAAAGGEALAEGSAGDADASADATTAPAAPATEAVAAPAPAPVSAAPAAEAAADGAEAVDGAADSADAPVSTDDVDVDASA